MAAPSAPGDGRTYHATQSVYILPNDNQEHRRLEATAERIRELLDDKVVHAPLDSALIHKVIDIGCGTGATTDELGATFPEASVYGVDLSAVPALRPKLNNIEYLQGDVVELAATETDTCLAKGTFDYVFSRFMMGGIMDWKGYIQLCLALLKPGAWIEMQEPDMARFLLPPSGNAYDVYSKTPTLEDLKGNTVSVGEDPESWRAVWQNLMRFRGLEPRVGALLANYFEDAGLKDVRIKRYVLPFGTWDGMTDAQRRMAPIHKAFVRDDAPGLIRKLGNAMASMSWEKVDKVVEDSKGFVDRFEGNREFGWVYVVCGRKVRAG
ncbi:hypothetical protein EKO04_002857 [Ascochyta lentis]|uniref:S-adenosyl-L-methionine-dependent methyltransferase n=1 Tax=Ascochyta lentis TaxID=205686 RepID=A0A8H7JAD9_9PLEO|nr:hypothetical protein EKO04_002857 [Ascochyta lentis]